MRQLSLMNSELINSMNSSMGFESSDLGSPRRVQPQSNRVATIRNQIHPTNLRDEDNMHTSKSRKILAQNIERGEGDLNTIWDAKRIKLRNRWHLFFTIGFLVLLGIALLCALAGLAVSIYYFVQYPTNSVRMSIYGIATSGFFVVFSIFSIIVVSIDGFYLQGPKLTMNDYTFFLDVDIKQYSMYNENILLYSPELVTNQIIPKYEQLPPPPPPQPQLQPVSPNQIPIRAQSQNQIVTTPIQIQRMRPRGKYIYVN